MSIPLYMDVHVRRALTDALRLRSVDLLTAQEDGTAEYTDVQLLDCTAVLRRALFTHDQDFLREGAARLRRSQFFAGILYAHQVEMTIGQCLESLEMIAKAGEPDDVANRIIYLPL